MKHLELIREALSAYGERMDMRHECDQAALELSSLPLTEEEIDILATEEAERNLYLISASYPDMPMRVELLKRGIELARDRGLSQPVAHHPSVEQIMDAFTISGTALIAGSSERWVEFIDRGEDGPHSLTEDPWRSFHSGWLEGRVALCALLRSRLTALFPNNQK